MNAEVTKFTLWGGGEGIMDYFHIKVKKKKNREMTKTA